MAVISHMALIASMAAVVVPPPIVPTVEYTGKVTGGGFNYTRNLTLYAVPLGTPEAGRKIFICMARRKSFEVSSIISCTLGGAAATVVLQANTTGLNEISWFVFDLPAGTTADFNIQYTVVTGNEKNQISVAAYKVMNLNSVTPTDTHTFVSGYPTGSSVSGSVTVQADGIILAAGLSMSGFAMTMAGISQEFTIVATNQCAGGSYVSATTTDINTTWTATTAGDPAIVLCIAALR